MTESTFTRRTLRTFAGVLVWAAHFGTIYTVHALACSRGHIDNTLLGANVVIAVIVAVTVAAAGVLAAVIVRALRAGTAAFENWLMATIGALSLIAVLWQGLLPALMVPVCR
jgi:hypothetical protein